MSRPSRLEILEYALQGALTERGVMSGGMEEWEEDQLDEHIDWLEKEIAKIRERTS